MKVVILCGGEGTRFKNNLTDSPKVMANIGNKPILWHIMRYYQHFGFNDFILCLGENKEAIINYFENDSSFGTVELVFTGNHTPTGGRVKLIENYIQREQFLVTYGDGLSNIDINKLVSFHKKHQKLATLSAIQPYSQFGVMTLNASDIVTDFMEKPKMRKWVNGGYFVFNKDIFDYLEMDKSIERSLFNTLVKKEELAAFKHDGFWKSMDTFKENIELNELWDGKKAAWKVW